MEVFTEGTYFRRNWFVKASSQTGTVRWEWILLVPSTEGIVVNGFAEGGATSSTVRLLSQASRSSNCPSAGNLPMPVRPAIAAEVGAINRNSISLVREGPSLSTGHETPGAGGGAWHRFRDTVHDLWGLRKLNCWKGISRDWWFSMGRIYKELQSTKGWGSWELVALSAWIRGLGWFREWGNLEKEVCGKRGYHGLQCIRGWDHQWLSFLCWMCSWSHSSWLFNDHHSHLVMRLLRG